MNFLAHILLSEQLDEICIGNFIADHIKGNNYKMFSPLVQRGIKLHREIDFYTDAHPIHKRSRRRLDPKYGHYKGVIIDIFYDHFLAKNWSEYHRQNLEDFTLEFYDLMLDNSETLPEQVNHMLTYMIPQNWLYNYQNFDGLQQVMNGMNRRTKGLSKMDQSLEDLKENYNDFESDFSEFFEDLLTFSKSKLIELKNE